VFAGVSDVYDVAAGLRRRVDALIVTIDHAHILHGDITGALDNEV